MWTWCRLLQAALWRLSSCRKQSSGKHCYQHNLSRHVACPYLLSHAILSSVLLCCAVLCYAECAGLYHVVLCNAALCMLCLNAVLCCAVLCCAVLCCAVLCFAMACKADLHSAVPLVTLCSGMCSPLGPTSLCYQGVDRVGACRGSDCWWCPLAVLLACPTGEAC